MNCKIGALTIASMFVLAPRAHAACTATGFVRDGINLTAALINPATVTTPLDATACDIGVYYDHNVAGGVATLTSVDIGGARYYGVVANGDAGSFTVHINNNFIHHIGNKPFDGTQHGIGLYIRAFFGFNVTGDAMGNYIFAYQKGGIVATGKGVKLSKLDNNKIYGLGHVSFIAQNGIQISYGALPFPSEVIGNTITANSYTQAGTQSAGILILGGPGFGLCPDNDPCPYAKTVLIGINSALNAVGTNFVFNNDVGVWAYNLAGDGVSPPPTPTNNFIVGTLAGGDQAANPDYQAGISDFGNTDYIVGNYIIQGGGYGTPCTSNIDTTGSINPQTAANTPMACSPPPVAAARPSATRLKPSPDQP